MAESAKDRRAREAIENLSRQLRDMREERDALAAHVERLRNYLGKCHHHACYSIGESEALALQMAKIRETADQGLQEGATTSLAHHNADLVGSLRFPTMLRKMWSGGDVQQWLDEQADEYRRLAEEVAE